MVNTIIPESMFPETHWYDSSLGISITTTLECPDFFEVGNEKKLNKIILYFFSTIYHVTKKSFHLQI